jgi:hypothetical protein
MKISFKHIVFSCLFLLSILGYYQSSGKETTSLRELTSLNVPDDCESSSNNDCVSKNGNIYPGYKKKAAAEMEAY